MAICLESSNSIEGAATAPMVTTEHAARRGFLEIAGTLAIAARPHNVHVDGGREVILVVQVMCLCGREDVMNVVQRLVDSKVVV